MNTQEIKRTNLRDAPPVEGEGGLDGLTFNYLRTKIGADEVGDFELRRVLTAVRKIVRADTHLATRPVLDDETQEAVELLTQYYAEVDKGVITRVYDLAALASAVRHLLSRVTNLARKDEQIRTMDARHADLVTALRDARDAVEIAAARIKKLSHVICRDQNALWNGTQLGPASEEDLEKVKAALASINAALGDKEER